MKVKRRGKATILTAKNFSKLLAATLKDEHRLLYQIAYWTGERMGAIRQLRVEDVYRAPGQPHEWITYHRETRKGQQDDRQVPIHPTLNKALMDYSPPATGYLFPGAEPGSCLAGVTVDQNLRHTLIRAGLDNRGITTHSFRRTFLTNLANLGISPWVIQQISGHKDRKSLDEYIEVTDRQVREAVGCL
jgi:integrase/recombinase XerD